MKNVPVVCRQGTETEQIIAFSYSPFILLRGDDIIIPLSEVIGITQYTNSITNSCQYFKLFSCQIFYASWKTSAIKVYVSPHPYAQVRQILPIIMMQKQRKGKGKKQEFEQSDAGLSAFSEVILDPEHTAEFGVWFVLPEIPLGRGQFLPQFSL